MKNHILWGYGKGLIIDSPYFWSLVLQQGNGIYLCRLSVIQVDSTNKNNGREHE